MVGEDLYSNPAASRRGNHAESVSRNQRAFCGGKWNVEDSVCVVSENFDWASESDGNLGGTNEVLDISMQFRWIECVSADGSKLGIDESVVFSRRSRHRVVDLSGHSGGHRVGRTTDVKHKRDCYHR